MKVAARVLVVRRLSAVFVIVSCWLAVAAPAPAVAAVSPFGWGTAALIDSPGLSGWWLDLSRVSCAGPTLCVAIDRGGAIVTSTAPTGGPLAWTAADLPQVNGGLLLLSWVGRSRCA